MNDAAPTSHRRAALPARALTGLDDLAAFVEIYFTDERRQPLRLSSGQRRACATLERGVGADRSGAGLQMARGHGKSMLMKALTILAFLRSWYAPERWGSRYAAVLTSGKLYKQFSADIGCLITGVGAPLVTDGDGRPLLHADYQIRPAFDHPRKKLKELHLWNTTEKLVYIGPTWDHPCRLSVRGMTAGRGDVRGLTQGVQRPDLLIVDDPMKRSEAGNAEITENIKTFVKQDFIPCGSPTAKQMYFGTPFSERDLITEVCGNAGAQPLRSEWPGIETITLPAIHPASGAPLAPGVWPIDRLQARRADVGSRAFSQEYLLRPVATDVRHFDPAWIAAHTVAPPVQSADGKRLRRVMFCDPSLGKSAKSDEIGMVVTDYDAISKTHCVLHAEIVRLRPQGLVNRYLDLWVQWRPHAHAVEDAGAQELLIPIFAAEIAARGLPVQATPRLQGHEGVAKVTRIKRLSPMIEFGRITWSNIGSHAALRAQMTGWGGGDDEPDDGLDALEGAVRLGGDVGGLDAIRQRQAGLAGLARGR